MVSTMQLNWKQIVGLFLDCVYLLARPVDVDVVVVVVVSLSVALSRPAKELN